MVFPTNMPGAGWSAPKKRVPMPPAGPTGGISYMRFFSRRVLAFCFFLFQHILLPMLTMSFLTIMQDTAPLPA